VWTTSDKPDKKIKMAVTAGTKEGDEYHLKEGKDGQLSIKKKKTAVAAGNTEWKKYERQGQQMVANSRDSSAVIKFTNHRAKAIDIFWDDGKEGVPQGSVGPNRTKCQSSYVGHKFFFTELGSTKKITSVVASIDEPGKLIMPEVVSPELAAFIATDKKFRDEYYERTGVHWLAEIDRPPPRWHQWEAKEVGQKHVLTTNETLFETLPEKGLDHHEDESKQCRVPDENEEVKFELEVISTHPKVFKIKVSTIAMYSSNVACTVRSLIT
jgi:hypothetical protein